MAPTRASSGTPAAAAKPAAPASSGAFGFDDLWAASSGTASTGAAAQKGKGKMSLAEMARDKSSSAVWGSNAPAQQPPQQAQKKPDLFDLL
jgi:epsin